MSQDCQLMLSGTVIDEQHADGLEYATIYIQELGKGVACDEKGKYIIMGICPGNYHFLVSHLGCETKSIYMSIDSSLIFDFYLEHHDELLEQVEISGQDNNLKLGTTKYMISKDMLFELNGRNLTEILSTIPGVNMLKSGPNLSKPIINGLYGNRITILNHGIPQEGQQWGNDHTPEIDPNTADKISVYKGAAAIKYGLQSMGGVVILEPNEMTYDPHWHGEIRLNGQSNGRAVGVNAIIKKSTLLGNIRATLSSSIAGDRKSPSYYLTNTGNTDRSASLYVTSDINNKWVRKVYLSLYSNNIAILRGSHIGNTTDLKEAFVRNIPFYTEPDFSYDINAPKQNIYHYLLKFTNKYRVNEQSYYQLDAGFQINNRKEYDIRRNNYNEKPSLSLLLFSQYYDFNYNHETKNINNSMGLQYRYVNNTNDPGTGILPLIPDYINNHIALYDISRVKIASIPIELGIRTEYRNYFVARIDSARMIVKENIRSLNWAANIGIKKQITKDFQTGVDVSYTNRPPEINELFSNGLHQGVSGLELGNAKLKAENSFKITNEWIGHVTQNTHLSASIFYNNIRNYIYLQPQKEFRLTIRGAFPVFKYVGTNASLSGLSTKITHDVTKMLQLIGGLNYIYAKNISQDTGLIRIPPFSAFSHINYTMAKTKYFNEIKIGIEGSYTARQSYAPPSEDFLLPPDAYFLMNASIRVKFKKRNNSDIDVSTRIDNIFNIQYRDYLNRLRYFSDEMGRNISINIRFIF
ncbi:MAG: carboxypeptidase-like regulatory domain-containing protein [Saprospiraceae bacterium]|nr:carboxypeptidase-like regulatory domain-containing protein [Saprospiraceae bacterium]